MHANHVAAAVVNGERDRAQPCRKMRQKQVGNIVIGFETGVQNALNAFGETQKTFKAVNLVAYSSYKVVKIENASVGKLIRYVGARFERGFNIIENNGAFAVFAASESVTQIVKQINPAVAVKGGYYSFVVFVIGFNLFGFATKRKLRGNRGKRGFVAAFIYEIIENAGEYSVDSAVVNVSNHNKTALNKSENVSGKVKMSQFADYRGA